MICESTGISVLLTFYPGWIAIGLVAALVLTAARNLYLQSRLDYGLPVLEIQRRVAELRAWRLREAVLYAATGCLIWVPFLLLLFASVGADVWKNAPQVVWWNLAAWSMWGLMLLVFRYALERRRQRAEQQAALEAIEASLELIK